MPASATTRPFTASTDRPHDGDRARKGSLVEFGIRAHPEIGTRTGRVTHTRGQDIYVSNVAAVDAGLDEKIFGTWINRDSFSNDPDETYAATLLH